MKKGFVFSLVILSAFTLFAVSASPASAEFLPPSGSPSLSGNSN